MQRIDLSHPIVAGMVTYPGLPGPVITDHLSRADSRAVYDEGVEFQIGRIDMVANTGTYVDAPFHRFEGGTDLADLPLEHVAGVPITVAATEERRIGPQVFEHLDVAGRAVLVHTGWDRHFGMDSYLGGHPHLTGAAAELLVEKGALLVGIDSANIDATDDGQRPVHSALLAAGIPCLEHLTNLGSIPPDEPALLWAIPPPVAGMGTFPVRAVASVGSL